MERISLQLQLLLLLNFAFSAGKGVLDEKRTCVAPYTIQICVFMKDWDQEDIQTQGMKNNDDQGNDDPWMLMDMSALSNERHWGYCIEKKMMTKIMIRINNHWTTTAPTN